MNTLIYSSDGVPYSDFSNQFVVLGTLGGGLNLHTSTEPTVHCVRALFKNGIIPKFKIKYININDEEFNIEMLDNGEIHDHPIGFCDSIDRYFSVLFGVE